MGEKMKTIEKLFECLGELDELDDLIYQNNEYFNYDLEHIKTLQYQLISKSFAYHLKNNDDYFKYAKRIGVGLEDIKSFDDLYKIPLIPSTMFKLTKVSTAKEADIVKVCTSSGTKGSLSRVYRDESTLQRFLGGMQSIIDNMLELDDVFCINLGPNTGEAGDLWFSYVLSLIDMVFPTESFVVDGSFYPDKVFSSVIENKNYYENIVIIGAPIMFVELIDYAKKNGISIEHCENIYCITAGGWKRMQGKAIKQNELYEMLAERFKGLPLECFRDILNMVELNSIFCECEYRIKHVPLWVKVFVLDPFELKPVKDGETGVIAFLDSSASSYPGFVLTDDLGRIVLNGKCKCRRCGTGLEIIRRIENKESRGCALKIDKKYSRGG